MTAKRDITHVDIMMHLAVADHHGTLDNTPRDITLGNVKHDVKHVKM